MKVRPTLKSKKYSIIKDKNVYKISPQPLKKLFEEETKECQDKYAIGKRPAKKKQKKETKKLA